VRILAIGAHPDDCEYHFGGTAAKFARAGHAVKFLSMTNGSAGHHELRGPELAARRRTEAAEAARRLGIAESEVLDNHDAALLPLLDVRLQAIRGIRRWEADVVFIHRPNDYHPDHRYASIAVQDASYLVRVPSVALDTPVLRKNPVFFYYEDRFQRPAPFRADVAVAIDDAWEVKVDALDAHVSQFYEWLPWIEQCADDVPAGAAERRAWLAKTRAAEITPAVRATLERHYGPRPVAHAEAFELCEYGRRPPAEELAGMFPE
jgi:LmbE family N-acetylglucosaminyl deacetylase